MDLGLTDKVALVTGASKGIGKAVALALAAEGARVAVVARDAAALDKVAAECRDRSRKDAVAIAADLSRLEETERVVRETKERCGRVDILVNNAGAIRGGDFLKIPDAQWMGDWNLKLLGYIRMARAVLPIMQEQGGGRICNVVGAAGRHPAPTNLTGGAANAALINFTKGLAELGAPSKILVTAVSPAATKTERWDSLIAAQAAASGRSAADLQKEAEASYKLGRIATSEDIADMVTFLVSARASFVTGICITVDGGSTRGVYP
jgi:3-oxoacyl-[acyl-carrier protein] reductase